MFNEILVFGATATIQSIEKIKYAPYRIKMRRDYEVAFIFFTNNNDRYKNMPWPKAYIGNFYN